MGGPPPGETKIRPAAPGYLETPAAFPMWLVALAGRTPASLRSALPPRALRQRVRWIVLVVSLIGICATAPVLVTAPAATPLRLAGLGALLWLAGCGLHRFGRGEAQPIVDLSEAVAVLLATLAIGPMPALGVLVVGVFGHTLYDSGRRVTEVVILYLVAHAVAVTV